MISKRRAIKIANKVNEVVFGSHKPTLDVRFVKRSPKRILKAGFRTLVPGARKGWNNAAETPVVIHLRHDWRNDTEDQLASVLAHELLHAKQVMDGDLHQDEKGILTYLGDEYWIRWNVNYKQWQVCRRGSFDNIWRVPWEAAVVASQPHVAKLAMFELRHKPLIDV